MPMSKVAEPIRRSEDFLVPALAVLCQISIARLDGDLRRDEAAPLMWSTLLALLRSVCSALKSRRHLGCIVVGS